MARVFVSHASQDLVVAETLLGWLRDAGHTVFLDRDLDSGLLVGEAWRGRLYEEIQKADALVAVVTAAFSASPWCAAEVGIAQAYGLRVLPVRAEVGAGNRLVPSETEWSDMTADPDRAEAELVEALRRLDATGGVWHEGRSPFPGLRPFDAGLARVFFGRQEETRHLAGLLRAPATDGAGLVVVVGPSGCGKSSLVQAGLAPRLTADPDWLVLPPVKPGADPAGPLARALARAGRTRGLGWDDTQAATALRSPAGLATLAELLLDATVPAQRMLLVLDQAEELLTQTPKAVREEFAALLRAATAGPVRAVATLRSEYLDPLAELASAADLPLRPFVLRPLARDMLNLVITGPAHRAGLRIDDELVTRIVADTDDGQALPLLAYTLECLHAEAADSGEVLSAGLYDKIGGVRGALTGQADAALGEAATGQRTRTDVLRTLLRMVTTDEAGHITRLETDYRQFTATAQAEIDIFVRRRLLTTRTDTTTGNGTVWVEVVHEAFLRAWPPLAKMINDHQSALRTRATVEAAAETWNDSGRHRSYLWDRFRLAAGVSAVGVAVRRLPQPLSGDAAHPLRRLRRRVAVDSPIVELSSRAQEFLMASARRNRRRSRQLTAATVAVLLVAVTLTGIAVWQRQEAVEQREIAVYEQRRATIGEIVARAEQLRGSDIVQALKLSLVAERIDSTSGTRDNLAATFTSSPLTATVDDQQNLTAVAFSPDGNTLATTSHEKGGGRLRVWDVTDRRHPTELASVDDDQILSAVAFSPDGNTLATTSRSGDKNGGRLRVWDLRDRRNLMPLAFTDDDQGMTAVAFSPDGNTLATTSGELLGSRGRLRVWALTAQRHLTELAAVDDDQKLSAVAFSPDGNTFATTSGNFGRGRLRVWEFTGRRHLTELASVDDDDMTAVAFSPDGNTLTTTTSRFDSSGGRLRVWDVSDRRHPSPLADVDDDQYLTAVAFSPDNNTLAVTSGDSSGGRLRVWDLSDRHNPTPLVDTDNDQGLTAVAFSPDGSTLATTSSVFPGEGRLQVWDVINRRDPTRLASIDQELTTVAFSPDGNTLATTNAFDDGHGGRLQLWDLTDRRHPVPLAAVDDDQRLTAAAFSPDGDTLATTSDVFDDGHGGRLQLWDLTDLRRPIRIANIDDDQDLTAVAFSPDGDTLATTSRADGDRSGGRLRMWDVTDQRRPTELARVDDDQDMTAVAFTHDGNTLAASRNSRNFIFGSGWVGIWDVTDRSDPVQLADAPGLMFVTEMAFSPDDNTLAITSGNRLTYGLLQVLDVNDRGNPVLLAIIPDDQGLEAVAFSSDGNTLATVGGGPLSGRGRIRLWDLTDRRNPTLLANIDEDRPVAAAAFSPDGNTLATASGNSIFAPEMYLLGGRLRVWDVEDVSALSGNIREWACAAAGGGLSREEWPTVPGELPYQQTCP